MEYLIVATLQERAVNVDDRTHADFGLSGRERNGVGFADPDVEKTIGEFFAERFQFVPLAHRGGDDGDLVVVFHLVVDCITRVVRIGLAAGF